MSVCKTLQVCAIYLYPLLLIVYLNYGFEIIHPTLKIFLRDDAIHVYIKPDILFIIIWIFISFIPILYHLKGDNSNIFKSSLFVLFIGGAWSFISREQLYIYGLLSWCLVSIAVYKQFSLYQQIKIQHCWFDGNLRNSDVSWSNNSSLKWIMYFFTNILLYIHLFVYLEKCNIISIQMALHKTWILIMPIPYYLSPNLKYDLYHNRIQMIAMLFTALLSQIWMVFYAFCINNYININHNIHILLVLLSRCCAVITWTVLPIILDIYKRKRFIKSVEFHNNDLRVSYWDYILLNDNNFQQFAQYLIYNMIYQPFMQHLLFLIEVVQYKNVVLTKLNILQNNDEYLLAINDMNNLSSINISQIVHEIYELQVEHITIKRVKNDMLKFYHKYIQRYDRFDESQHNELYLSFLSITTKSLIQKNLRQMDGFQILNLFDDAIKEINSILQLLYREYVIQ